MAIAALCSLVGAFFDMDADEGVLWSEGLVVSLAVEIFDLEISFERGEGLHRDRARGERKSARNGHWEWWGGGQGEGNL